ncbi:MAG: hypothetical protein U0793_19805 [Gemmataceae bacterium]
MKTLASTVLWIQLVLAAAASAQTRPLWTLDTRALSYGGGAIGDLAGDGNLVIVPGTYFNDEHLYAVRAGDGVLLWKRKSEGGPFDASVALVDLDGDGKLEVLAVPTSTGTLFCLNHKGRSPLEAQLPQLHGFPARRRPLDGDGKPHIVVGVMALGDRHGRVIALDAATARSRWQAKVPGHVQSEPALVDLNGDGVLDAVVTTSARRQKGGAERQGRLLFPDGPDGRRHVPRRLGHPRQAAAHRRHPSPATSASSTPRARTSQRRKIGGYLFGPTSVGRSPATENSGIVVPGSASSFSTSRGTRYGGARSTAACRAARRSRRPARRRDARSLLRRSDRKFRILKGKRARSCSPSTPPSRARYFEDRLRRPDRRLQGRRQAGRLLRRRPGPLGQNQADELWPRSMRFLERGRPLRRCFAATCAHGVE